MSVNLKSRHLFSIILISVLVLFIYLRTMPPGLTWEHWGYDAGDLISCVYTWGIPHPPGTPLYVLVGQLFRHLPFFDNPAAKFNFMSIVFGWLSVLVCYFTVFRITQRRSASLVAALFLAFAPLVWGQNIIAEVLPLNLFLTSLLTYFLIFWEQTATFGKRNDRVLYYALFCFALSLTNHTASVTLAPAILFLILSTAPDLLRSVSSLAKIVAIFLLGLSPYIYLPVRAAMKPPLNWGDPSSLGRFISHVTAREYQGMLFFKSQRLVLDNAFRFLSSLWRNFNPAGFLLGALGLVFSKKNRIRDFLIFASIFPLIFIFNYNIVNIETYYLPVFFNFAILIGWGVLELSTLFRRVVISLNRRSRRLFLEVSFRRKKLVASFGKSAYFAFLLVLIIAGLVDIPLRYREVDLSKEHKAEDYGRETFKVLEPGAIVLTGGDNYTLGLTYFKYVVFSERTDVAVLHEAFLYKLGWMLKQARRNYPYLKFPRTEATNNEDQALKDLLSFIELNRSEHPIYLAVGDPPPRPGIAQRTVYADTYIVQSVGPVFKIIGRK